MHRLSKKLLAIMLAILLGFAPLQGAIAGYVAVDDQPGNVHHPVSLQANMGMPVNPSAQDHEQCGTDLASMNHCCSSGHCASCAVGITQVSILSTINISEPLPIQVDDRFVSQPSTALFRPPKS